MKAGSTFIVVINSDVEAEKIEKVEKIIFTLKGAETIVKNYPDEVNFSDGSFFIPLTQEDTLALAKEDGVTNGRKVFIEGQFNFIDKSVLKSDIKSFFISSTLATEIVEGNTPTQYDIADIKFTIDGDIIVAQVDVEGLDAKIEAEVKKYVGDIEKTLSDLDKKVESKVEKVEGKSLVEDTEIKRLKDVHNYDDAQVKKDITDLKNDKVDKRDGYSLVSDEEKQTWNGKSDFSGDYNDLENKPDPSSFGTKVEANPSVTEESPVLGSLKVGETSYRVPQGGSGGGDVTSVNGKVGAVVLNAQDVKALPDDTELFDGDYNSLINKPTLFSGDYNDLENRPTIPSKLSDLTEDASHRTVNDLEKEAWNGKSDFNGDYENLTNKPTIPSNLSELESDADHRTVTDEQIEKWNQSGSDVETVDVVNVKNHGVVGDGVTDDTSAIQTLLNTIANGSTLYFPQGIYVVSDTLTVKRNINIVGETRYGTFTSDANKIHSASTLSYVGDANKPLLVKDGANYINLSIQNMSFYGNSYNVTETGHKSKANDYGKYYSASASKDNVNGVDLTGSNGSFFIANCYFNGFSGKALILTQHKKVLNCGFLKCNIGVMPLTYDCLLEYCWFSKCSFGIYTTVNNTLGIYDTWFDQIEQNAIKSTNQLTLNMIGGWIDMVDYSAICVDGTLSNARIDARMSRCGMCYAGANISEVAKADVFKACVIYAHIGASCYINVTPQRRTIDGTSNTGICPSVIFGSDSAIKDSIIICPTNTSDNLTDYMGSTNAIFKNCVIMDGSQIKKSVGAFSGTTPSIVLRPNNPSATWKAMNPGDLFVNTKTNALFYAISTNAGDFIQISGGDASKITYKDTTVEAVLDNVNESQGRNKMPFPYKMGMKYVDSGLTFDVDNDGTIHVSGTVSNYTTFDFVKKRGDYELLPGTYTVSGGISNDIYLRVQNVTTSTDVTIATDTGNGATFTLTEKSKIYIYLQIRNNVTVDTIIYPMLELGQVTHGFEPPAESNMALKNELDHIFSDAWTQRTYEAGEYAIDGNRLWKCLVTNSERPKEGANWHQVTVMSEVNSGLTALNSNMVQKNDPHINGVLRHSRLSTDNNQIMNADGDTMWVGNPEMNETTFESKNGNVTLSQIRKLTSLENYSNTEVRIGTYNGKDVYRRVLTGNITAADTNVSFPYGRSMLRCNITLRNNLYTWPAPYYASSNDNFRAYITGSSIGITVGSSYPGTSNTTYTIVVEYTH